MRKDRDRLNDILEAIEKVEKYAAQGESVFSSDELVQVWVVHHLQIIGEAASKLSPELKERNPSLQWADIIAMRNILVHQYFGIDLKEVWTTVVTDIPALKRAVTDILESLPGE